MTERLTLLAGDWVEQLLLVPDETIDLTVTSPPYDDARTYGGHKWLFEAGAKELFRVTKPGGVVCWNVNDMVKDGSESLTSCKQKIYFVEQCGFKIHDTMIYEKSNGSKPDKFRYNQCMEYIFVLSKGKPKTFNGIRDKRNVTAGITCRGKHTVRQRDGTMKVRTDRKVSAAFGVRTNVWKGNTRGQEDFGKELKHPAMMPKWLAHDLIISWSNAGETVLDPMAGGGTVPQQALITGRNAIAIEVNPNYIPLIQSECRVTPELLLK